jgi:hypothetical protein
LAAAVLLVTLLAPAGAQAAPERDLVIEGRRSAVTEIELTEPLWAQDPNDVVITGGKEYAGAVVEPLDRQGGSSGPYYVVLRFRNMPTAVIPVNGGQFQPGRYRVRLFADAPARITVRLDESQTGRVIRPRRPMAVTTGFGQLDLTAGRSDDEVRLRGAVPARHGSILLMTVSGVRAEQTYGCATTDSTCPTLPARPPAPVPDAHPGVHPPSTSGGYSVTSLRGVEQPRDALFGVDGVRTADGALRAGVLTFSL